MTYVIATEFPTAEQKQNGEDGEPIAFRFGETVIALLKLAKPVKGGNQNWVLASAPSIDGPFDVLEDTYGKRMNHPLICLGRLAETAVNSVAVTKKTATAKPKAAKKQVEEKAEPEVKGVKMAS